MQQSSSLSLLLSDYSSLSKESGRRNSDVRDAADKAATFVKANSSASLSTLDSSILFSPIFLASNTRNAKVIALAVSALQRLITLGAVPASLAVQILTTLDHVIPQGVEIQLKILQTLVSLLTSTTIIEVTVGDVTTTTKTPLIQGQTLGTALELSHRLSTSKIPVVASTASATLRQLFMFVFERVAEEDVRLPLVKVVEGEEDQPPQERPALHDAQLLLSDLCLLIAVDPTSTSTAAATGDEVPTFLKWGSLSRTFGLELVESIVSGFGGVVRTHPALLQVLRLHLCPLLIRFLSAPPSPTTSSTSPIWSFPLTLRLTRVIFLLLKHFSDLLPLESEIFLSIFVRVVSPTGASEEGLGGHPGSNGGTSPGWMRVLALEIFRGLCGDFHLMIDFFERYDLASVVEGGGGSKVFSDLMTGFNRLATERPGLLGVGSAVLYGSSLGPISVPVVSPTGATSGGGSMIDSAMDLGSALVSTVVSSASAAAANTQLGHQPGLGTKSASIKLQCIDQLDKADSPLIPDNYIFLLALQCLVALADGFAVAALGGVSKLGGGVVKWSVGDDEVEVESQERKNLRKKLVIVKRMAEESWPALLAALSFYIGTNLDEDLFHDVVSALQNFTSVCGVLGLLIPREAFLTTLCRFSIPPQVVSYLSSNSNLSSSTNNPHHAPTPAQTLTSAAESLGLSTPIAQAQIGLSARNLICLKATVSVAQYLAGGLGKTWYKVFETLQNAEFVLKVSNSNKSSNKRNVSGVPPPVVGATTGTTPNSGKSMEELEANVQAGMEKLFEGSVGLEDEALEDFLEALARLSGEMVGLGLEVGEGETAGRRRQGGITGNRTLKQDEKSFGVTKLGTVALLNLPRLISRSPSTGAWALVTTHLLLLQHFPLAPSSIRLQAASGLDQLLLSASATTSIQPLVLESLANQAEPHKGLQTSTDVEIRRLAFETLGRILERYGHSFKEGWGRIFGVLRTACPSAAMISTTSTTQGALDLISEDEVSGDTSLNESFGPGHSKRPTWSTPVSSYFSGATGGAPQTGAARSPILVRTSFPSLQLICTDFLGVLEIHELRDCIGTLAEFGKQAEDVNVALTAGGLLWSVSDHLQGKRKDGDNDVGHGELWMFLLHQLLSLCQDGRQEARDGAISTIFRSISLYGSTLSEPTWDACFWEIVFPLLDRLSSTIASHNQELGSLSPEEELVPQMNGPPIRLLDKQWDDSKTLALKAMGNVFYEYLPVIIRTAKYDETWVSFVNHLKRGFVEDRPQVATASMQAFEKVLSVSLDGVDDDTRISSTWEVAWNAWDEIGHSVSALSKPVALRSGPPKTLTQVNLEAYTKVVIPIYSPSHITFDLERIQRLLAILKAILTFARSPDYRADVDNLTPLQASVLEVVAAIRLEVDGAASAVLSDLSEYLTLAFVGSFDAESETSNKNRPRVIQHVSYIALTKEVMPHVLWLFQRYKNDSSIYDHGAVERMLAAYALPMKLKHDCPAPSKYSSDELLWKTASVNFLKAVRDCVPSLKKFGSNLQAGTFGGIWRQIVEGYRGALLADLSHNEVSFEDIQSEENFDLALLVSIEQDILPHVGNLLVPDDLVRRLGKCLQTASRLYELDLPNRAAASFHDAASSNGSVSDQDVSSTSTKETRFDSDFDRQAKGEMFGTTAEVVEVGRERFGYWCFELLFLLCSSEERDNVPERRRIAALCLPSLMNRCTAVIRTYVADAPLRGKMPFPRVRQEELIFVLQKLQTCRLHDGALWASEHPDPSSSVVSGSPLDVSLPLTQLVRSALLRSPLAHLYELHPLFISLLSLSTTSPSITSAYIPYRGIGHAEKSDAEAFKGLPEGFIVRKIGRSTSTVEAGDVVQLALANLELVGVEIGAGGIL